MTTQSTQTGVIHRNPNAHHDENATYRILSVQNEDQSLTACLYLMDEYEEFRPQITELMTACVNRVGDNRDNLDEPERLRSRSPSGYHNVNQILGARLIGHIANQDQLNRLIIEKLTTYCSNRDVVQAYLDRDGNLSYAFNRSKVLHIVMEPIWRAVAQRWAEPQFNQELDALFNNQHNRQPD